jgi:hypothetical protein
MLRCKTGAKSEKPLHLPQLKKKQDEKKQRILEAEWVVIEITGI